MPAREKIRGLDCATEDLEVEPGIPGVRIVVIGRDEDFYVPTLTEGLLHLFSSRGQQLTILEALGCNQRENASISFNRRGGTIEVRAQAQAYSWYSGDNGWLKEAAEQPFLDPSAASVSTVQLPLLASSRLLWRVVEIVDRL